MKPDRNRNYDSNLKGTKELNIKNNQKLKPLYLLSSNSNSNINYKHINLIPLSRLFKNKLNYISPSNNLEEITKFNSVGKVIISQDKRNYGNPFKNYNSFSQKKISLIKLPKLKNINENKEIKDSLIEPILNKFDEYDNKFKEQAKISESIIKRGDRYLKLKKNYINEEEKRYKKFSDKYNYKKQYSKLFKKIKSIHLI